MFARAITVPSQVATTVVNASRPVRRSTEPRNSTRCPARAAAARFVEVEAVTACSDGARCGSTAKQRGQLEPDGQRPGVRAAGPVAGELADLERDPGPGRPVLDQADAELALQRDLLGQGGAGGQLVADQECGHARHPGTRG